MMSRTVQTQQEEIRLMRQQMAHLQSTGAQRGAYSSPVGVGSSTNPNITSGELVHAAKAFRARAPKTFSCQEGEPFIVIERRGQWVTVQRVSNRERGQLPQSILS